MRRTRRRTRRNISVFLTLLAVYVYLYLYVYDPRRREPTGAVNQPVNRTIHLVVVACRDRRNEAMVMLKSSVLFTRTPLIVHIFADAKQHAFFTEKLLSWPSHILKRFHFQLHPIHYLRVNQSAWDKPSRECVFQRLFLPERLPDIDSLLYVDTDVVFLSPVDSIMENFHQFNSTQMVAMTPDHIDPVIAHYNHLGKTPFYGKLGLNSGVSLMNLTRMRKVNFIDKIIDYRETYRSKMVLGDQDLWNIYFHFYPDHVFELDCNWNFRDAHCRHGSDCVEAEKRGSYLVHGTTRAFVNKHQPAFKALYDVMSEYQLGEDLESISMSR